MLMSGRTAAKHFLQQSFPHCDVAFLGGSAANQSLTEHSDLDIVILDSDSTNKTSFRQCSLAFGWKIEAFVYNEITLFLMFEMNRTAGLPSILRMCAEGIILKDNGSAIDIQNAAWERLQQGPSPLTDEKQQAMRFMITDLLNDLNDSANDQEKIFIASKLFELVSEFVLRANGQWLGEGKWMYRSFLHYDKKFCDAYIEAYHLLIKTGQYEPFSKIIDEVLEPHGGQLFEGYQESL